MGAVVDDNTSFSYADIKRGKGFGLRYFTPIGPFRLDFGWAEGKTEVLNDMIIHFNIGQMF